MSVHKELSSDKFLGATDFDKWKHKSLKFTPGDLVIISHVPYYEDAKKIGKIGVIIKRTTTYGEFAPLYWDVLIEGKITPIHYNNMEKIERKETNE